MLKQKTSLSIGSAVVSGMLFLSAATASAAEKITYHHFDALGSPVAATDEQGNVLWRETYQPYGERIRNEVAAASNTRWYTGHPQDPETGLTYMGARYYDPVIGRFMAFDPQPFLERDPYTFNHYAYANNNPYRYIDPDGRSVLAVEGAKLGFWGGTFVCGPICGGIAGVVGFAGGLYLTDKAWDYIHASSDQESETSADKSPQVDPKDVAGKTPSEIDKLARERGLAPKGPDPKAGKGSYIDPVTGEQRILCHPNCNNPHAHVNDPSGNRLDIDGNRVPPESPQAHLPIRPEH